MITYIDYMYELNAVFWNEIHFPLWKNKKILIHYTSQ